MGGRYLKVVAEVAFSCRLRIYKLFQFFEGVGEGEKGEGVSYRSFNFH